MKDKTMKNRTISMPPLLIDMLDKTADKYKLTRSCMLEVLMELLIDEFNACIDCKRKNDSKIICVNLSPHILIKFARQTSQYARFAVMLFDKDMLDTSKLTELIHKRLLKVGKSNKTVVDTACNRYIVGNECILELHDTGYTKITDKHKHHRQFIFSNEHKTMNRLSMRLVKLYKNDVINSI